MKMQTKLYLCQPIFPTECFAQLIYLEQNVFDNLGGNSRPVLTLFELSSSGLCQDGNTSSRVITEVKHLELNQFSVGSNFLRDGKCCCRKVGNMGCPFEH